MALYDASDLQTRAARLLNRPDPDEAFTSSVANDIWFQYLGDAQTDINERIAVNCPDVAYGPPTRLTTSDGGLTYVFGNDADGNPIVPMGQIELRASPTGVYLLPGNDWDATTYVYLLDSNSSRVPVIRFPGQRTRTFSNGPWARFMVPTLQITTTASVVTLKPFTARRLIPIRAAIYGAQRLDQDTTKLDAMYEDAWGQWLFTMKTQQYGQGLRAFSGPGAPWWQGPDLGRNGY